MSRTFESLIGQDLGDWEWLVVGEDPRGWRAPTKSAQVRFVAQPGLPPARPAALALGASVALGEIVVELTSGGTLASGALTALVEAFARDDALGAVYAGSGYEALPYNVTHPEVTRAGMLAYRIDAYREAGGHDLSLGPMSTVDLVSRIFRDWEVCQIDLPVWDPQPVDEEINWLSARTVYERHIEANAITWARRQGLAAIDLAAPSGRPTPPAYERREETADLPDATVGVLRAVDVLAWADDRENQLAELHRLLAPGGMLLTRTVASPLQGGGILWDEAAWRRLVDEARHSFQIGRLENVFPTEWHRERSIPYVRADLIAQKEGGPQMAGPIR